MTSRWNILPRLGLGLILVTICSSSAAEENVRDAGAGAMAIDQFLAKKLLAYKIVVSAPASDAEFLRRADHRGESSWPTRGVSLGE